MTLSRLYTLAFAAGIAAWAALLIAGFYRAAVAEQELPPLRGDYGRTINRLTEEQRWDELARELRLVLTLDFQETEAAEQALPTLIKLAYWRGDRESALFGLRYQVSVHRDDALAHEALAAALLGTLPSPAELEEAAEHAERALTLAPGSVAARLHLGAIAWWEGRPEEAFARWAEAHALDTERTEAFLEDLQKRQPELRNAREARAR